MKSLLAFLKIIVLMAVVAGAYYAYDQVQQQRGRIEVENAATQKFNDGEYVEAAEAYERLLEQIEGEDRERVKNKLVACYITLSRNPELSLEEQAEYAHKALKHDPDAEVNKTMKRYIREILKLQ